MSEEMEEMIVDAVSNTFENLAFMFVEEVDKSELENTGDEYFISKMAYSGDNTGSLVMATTKQMCINLATNILGLDDDEEPEKSILGDAFNEVLNVVCGQLLAEKYGEKAIFDLTIPEISSVDDKKWNEFLELDETVGIMVDEFPVLIAAYFND